ncbi:hypothetical protein TPHA_0A05660 [Tetrapisispora phaffii CBS 4417]|uniref:Elongator complex protein 6 n=1 Tax=Tetrapisispora phaffii (strain ATCC 24235 / CBS 4417 / NBRC 1672 / NRRL Y-8282 / UCD 70-5) TaxID=1071381 RepID=G8BP12_TETPH|nr:hypothetical protein TPHA_0A05660 [Tetrapisispora phaffii CBS 4417]CCE61640.1 hypothetical protein TPHA_0A05660 [Tetrapisispora phaffii CBS 4417]
MNTAQKQDLLIFSDHSVISNQMCNGSTHDLILVTHSEATSPTWLLNALVETIVFGVPYSLKAEANSSQHQVGKSSSRNVSLCSFVHDLKFVENSLMKLKIDVNQCTFIDCMTNFIVNNIGKSNEVTLKTLVEKFPTNTNGTIFLEQPELLLSLLDDLTSDQLQKMFIIPLMKKCGLLIIASNTGLVAIDEDHIAAKELTEFKRFFISNMHKALVIMNLKPLDTGRAKDITGTLRITRGGKHNSYDKIHPVENEYLYLTKRDSTKLFYR